MGWRVPFGDLKITKSSRDRLNDIATTSWVSEGRYVKEFEKKFAAKFGWKHAVAVSSGTDAGMIVWAAIRDLSGKCHTSKSVYEYDGIFMVITPASAFVATANCLLAAGCYPYFADIDLKTLNLNPVDVTRVLLSTIQGIQFVATMGKPSPLIQIADIAAKHALWLVGDFCEAHGAMVTSTDPDVVFSTLGYADHLCDASIYSFYAAHLVIGGEGGIICTDDDELAKVCRSVKSHGRPSNSNYFDFQRIGFNSKWNEPCAAIALGSLENFDTTFERRREVRAKLLKALEPFEDKLILYRDGPGEIISPHAFPIVLREDNLLNTNLLYDLLEDKGIQCKTLFGSLPTQHKAFEFLGYKPDNFPVAERIGRTGLHFGCHEGITDDDIGLIADTIGEFFDG